MVKFHDISKTKIIATIGPATSSKDQIRQIIREGIDVCRLNFSHGSHDGHLQVIKYINEINNELGTSVAIMADLQGPKIRIGMIRDNIIELKENDKIIFTNNKCEGTKEKLYMSYQNFSTDMKAGESILIDDGKLKLEVIRTNNRDEVEAKVIYGGLLSSNKGVNLPNTKISLPSLTKKDIDDVEFILKLNVDWIALSFVRKADDVKMLKEIISSHDRDCFVMAKIEKPEALEDIDNIIKAADGIMVARGDLGVEVSFDKVPYYQKEIVNKCIMESKPVIIATQMMESMVMNFRPTRAEANDVANAVFDSADCLMLSAETSVGKYPFDAVRSMQQIIDHSESSKYVLKHESIPDKCSDDHLYNFVYYNACMIANQSEAKAIITFTHSGLSAMKLSSHRPNADIFAFTWTEKLIKKLTIVYGVRAFYLAPMKNIIEAVHETIEILKKKKFIKKGDTVVHVCSLPLESTRVNTIRIINID